MFILLKIYSRCKRDETVYFMPEEIKRLKLNELDKDMRLEGMALRIISPLGSERVQRALSPISNNSFRRFALKS